MHFSDLARRVRRCAGFAALGLPALPLPAQAHWRFDTDMASRTQPALGYDVGRNQVLLYGGSDGVEFDDTRLWDGSRWQLLPTSGGPGPRRGQLMCYDPSQSRLLLYGGQHDTTAYNDLWTWDGTGWQPIATSHAPPAGNVPMAMVYDTRRQRTVLFGSTSFNSDFWEFDGSDWLDVTPASGMPGAGQPAMAFDAGAGDVVLFERGDSTRMFTFDGSSVRFTAVAATPARPTVFALVYDPLRTRLVAAGSSVSGGKATFVLDRAAARWTQLTQDGPPQAVAAPVYDVARDRIVLQTWPSSESTASGGTWEFDGVSWQDQGGNTPRARIPGDLAWDGSRIVLYGGQSYYDTWEYRDGRWTLLVPQPPNAGNTHPGQLLSLKLVRDPLLPELLLLGGQTNSGGGLGCWRLHADQWSRVSTTHVPPARNDFAVARDTRRQRLVLFGGSRSGQDFDDTWTFDGSDWAQASPALSPAPRVAHGMAYDPLHDTVVMAGGSSNGGNRGETWLFDGADWRLAAATRPFPNQYPTKLVWDEARQRIVTLVASVAGARLDVWEWDGGDWHIRPTPTSPPAYSNAGLVATDRDVQTFGGSLGNQLVPFHWFLASDTLASMQPFGSGCDGGNGVLTLRGDGLRPWLGDELHLELGPLRPGPLVLPGLWFGWARDQWQGQPLPLDLGALGFPGCALAIAPDSPLGMQNQTNGTARLVLSLPSTSVLLGAMVFAQGFEFEPFAATLTTSQGLALTLGAR